MEVGGAGGRGRRGHCGGEVQCVIFGFDPSGLVLFVVCRI